MASGRGRTQADRRLAIERVYGRGDLKIFISSEMRSGKLKPHRLAVVEAIEQELPHHSAWHWERDGSIGPYSSRSECVHHAGTSDMLILILGSKLTPITHEEYTEAENEGAHCSIFVLDGVRQEQEVKDFIVARQSDASYKRFKTITELRTLVVGTVLDAQRRALRETSVQRRAEISRSQRKSSEGSIR